MQFNTAGLDGAVDDSPMVKQETKFSKRVTDADSDEEDEQLRTTDPNAFLMRGVENEFEVEDNDSECSASELRDKVPGDMTANE